MSSRLLISLMLIPGIGLAVQMCGCVSTNMEDPKQVVIAMFGAMEKNDQAALAHLLDLTELMKDESSHYALQGGEARLFTNPQEILDDLTNEGQTKQRWFSLQRIINKSEMMGDNATVEVTFVDKDASRGYLTKFGLKRIHGRWKIYSFQTEQQAPESP
ncbi:MAG: hypothetical protein JSU65_00230 [Candidatus Zixiibacteriota bacterium]|nr:MAG: hypothetical protein JSU65_00230 [candidate division Zixibacteria bacterium]